MEGGKTCVYYDSLKKRRRMEEEESIRKFKSIPWKEDVLQSAKMEVAGCERVP